MVSTRGPIPSRSPSVESNRSTQSNENRSRSVSRSRSRSASRSGSPASNRSRSGSPDSAKSRSRSRSASGSPVSRRSRSGSSKSRSGSAHSMRSNASRVSNRSKSPSRSRSRSRSASRSNRSGSVVSGRSRSKDRSRSQSRSQSRSKSGSPQPRRGSESEPEENLADATDLFGDADDISSDEDKGKVTASGDKENERNANDDDDGTERMEGDDGRQMMMMGDERDDEEKEGEPEPIPETRIDVQIPKISCDLGKEIHFVKLPNFLSVETRPFDPETYEDEIDEEETLDEEGRARLKLKVENTIRWREEISKEGDFVKHSNARLIRWSDGSLSLHLGSEIFDVYKQPLQGDHNHLFIRQGTGLQGQAVFRTKLSFRPHSTESFTHRKMTLSLADRSQKTSGIKILSHVGIDPDQDRKTLLKKEEEKLRQTVRTSKPRKRGDSSRMHLSQSYREEDGSEDESGISLNAIKNKYKSGIHSKGGAIYSSDEEGSDFEARRMKKLDKPKALKDSDTSDESD